MYKWSMEISTYLVNINFETISEILYRKVHGNFHVSCNIETNNLLFKNVLPKGSMEISMYPVILRLIQKFFTKRVDGNFHVLYPLTLRLIQKCFYLKGPWKFPCIL